MGISKRLVLASLVSMMMVVAFLIGFVPSHQTLRVRAADENALMDDVLSTILDAAKAGPPAFTSIASFSTIKLPDDQTDPIWMHMGAEPADPGATEDIFFGINGDIFLDYRWGGFSGELDSSYPFSMDLDLNALSALGETHWIYAFANALMLESQIYPFYLSYDEELSALLELTLERVNPQDIDPDGNGLPDDPNNVMNGLMGREMWAFRTGNGALIVMANLADAMGKDLAYTIDGVPISFDNVHIVAPSRDMLGTGVGNANLIPNGDDAYLIVELGPDLGSLLDDMGVAGLTDAVAAKQPAPLIEVAGPTLAQYVEISIIYNRADDGRPDDWQEIDTLPSAFPVELTISDLLASEGMIARFYSYPTTVGPAQPITLTATPDDDWTLNNPETIVQNGAATVELTNLSLFAPFGDSSQFRTLTTGVKPSGTGVVTPGGTHAVGTDAEVTATAMAGWALAGWEVDGNPVGFENPLTLTMDADHDVVAIFDAAIRVDQIVPDSTPLNTEMPVVVEGQFLGIPAQTLTTVQEAAAAYSVYLYMDGVPVGIPLAFDASAPEIVTANRIYAVAPAHSIAGTMNLRVVSNTQPAVYGDLQDAFEYGRKWTLTTFAVPIGSGTITPGGEYAPGDTAVVSATANPGYVLDHWAINEDVLPPDPAISVTMDEHKLVVAYFAEFDITGIEPNAGRVGGGTRLKISGSFPVLNAITTTALANAVYSLYFYKNDVMMAIPFDNTVPEIITADTIYAIAPAWGENSKVDIRLTDKLSPVGAYADMADAYSFVAPPTINWVLPPRGPISGGTVVGITGTALSTTSAVYFGYVVPENRATLLEIFSDTTIGVLTPPALRLGPVDVHVFNAVGQGTAPQAFEYTFESATLTTSVSPENSGTVSPSGVISYTPGETVSVTATANPGWMFSHWTVDGGDSGDFMPLIVTVDKDMVVTAVFLKTYDLMTGSMPPAGGSITPAPGTYTYLTGSQPTVSADAAPGYVLDHWEINGEFRPPDDSLHVMLDADKQVVAVFAEFAINEVVPNAGPVTGSNSVAIRGTFPVVNTITSIYEAQAAYSIYVYQGATRMNMAFDASAPEIVTANAIYAVIPGWGQATLAGIRITDKTYENRTANLDDSYEYVWPPSILGLDPTQGPTIGGTMVAITGTTLATASGVYFGYVHEARRATNLTIIDDTEIRAVTPAVPGAGLVDVIVVTAGGQDQAYDAFEYTEDFWTLTTRVSPPNSGTTSPEGVRNYTPGTVVQLEATANPGWQFDHWTVDGVDFGANPWIQITMDQDKEAVAVFAKTWQLTTSVNPPGAGTVDPAEGAHAYLENTAVDVSTAANPGWVFDRWTVNGADAGATASIQLLMDEDKDVVAVFVKTWQLTTSVEPIGTGTVDPPAGVYTHLDGTVVNLSATPTADWMFSHWTINGAPIAGGPLLMLTMDEDKNVAAVFTGSVNIYTLTTVSEPDGAGVLDPIAGVHYYAEGTNATVSATANAGWTFDHWTVDGADAGAAMPLVVPMNANRVVAAVFLENQHVLATAVVPENSGTVAVDPLADFYAEGQVVTLTATANEGWVFDHWTVDALLIDGDDPVLDVTMDSDKLVTAFFMEPPVPMTITPADAWLFGGVAAEIQGEGFNEQTLVHFDDVPAQIVDWSDTRLLVIVPRWDDPDGTAAAVDVTVVVDIAGAKATFDNTINFTYHRYKTEGDVLSTAFVYDASEDTAGAVVADIDLGTDGAATLTLPVMAAKDTGDVYGLVRASKTAGTLPTQIISDELGANRDIADIWDFDVHLYEDDAELNTPSLAANVATYVEVEDWQYDRSDENAGALYFPVNATGLTIADVKDGLSLWAVDSQYDYTEQPVAGAPVQSMYQSTLLANSVRPRVTEYSLDTTAIQRVSATLYDLNAFSLKRMTPLPDDLVEQIRASLVLDPAIHPDGTASGPTDGGTPVRIFSDLGGLGYQIDRVVFGSQNKAFSGAAAVISEPRDTQYRLDLISPSVGEPGWVDIAIYPKAYGGAPVQPWILTNAFQYKAAVPPTPPVNVPWGLIALLLGLLAGAPNFISGDHDSGPCFIATAAYGTPMADQIDTLRALRDTYLLDNAAGTAFVDFYYRVSPAIAQVVAKSPLFAAAVRLTLMPVIFLAKLALALPGPSFLLAMAAMASLTLQRIRRRKKA